MSSVTLNYLLLQKQLLCFRGRKHLRFTATEVSSPEIQQNEQNSNNIATDAQHDATFTEINLTDDSDLNQVESQMK